MSLDGVPLCAITAIVNDKLTNVTTTLATALHTAFRNIASSSMIFYCRIMKTYMAAP